MKCIIPIGNLPAQFLASLANRQRQLQGYLMWLSRLRLRGFQSFADSGTIEFSKGVNLFVGQNNVGKSAILRAISDTLPDDRHRNSKRWENHLLPLPEAEIGLNIKGRDIAEYIKRTGYHVQIPIPDKNGHRSFIEHIFNTEDIELDLLKISNRSIRSVDYPSHNLFNATDEKHTIADVYFEDENIKSEIVYGLYDESLPAAIDEIWKMGRFAFHAERLTVGESPHGYSDRLAPNASNLPVVLHVLQNERGNVFRKLVDHLRQVFPTVGNLSVRTRPDNNNSLEIRIWPSEQMERVDLSFPLSASGTGVAQVIAILTAIMTIEDAVIIIDEINSFIHPSALKNLLRILQTNYSNHQYIISTHAPEVIAYSNPQTIHLVKRAGYDSTVERLDLSDVNRFRDVAELLGISMADVFAADRVIWVEGPTEELTFPYLYQSMSQKPIPQGTVFTSVATTGDFNRKRDREIVYEIYNRLSTAAANLVVSVIFSFDTEDLNDKEKSKMIRDAGGHLHFLPRRHIECYLVDPEAIAAMLIAKDESLTQAVTSIKVTDELARLAASQKFYIKEWENDLTSEKWLAKVDAANLIARLTVEISEGRAMFNKKKDSLMLLKHILSHTPEKMRPLYGYVNELVDAVTDKVI